MKKSLKTKRFTLSEQLREAQYSNNRLTEKLEELERVLTTLSSRVSFLEVIFSEGKTQLMSLPKAE